MEQAKVRHFSLGVVLAVLAAILVAPQAAQAAPDVTSTAADGDRVSVAFTRNCPSGTVVSLANNLPVRYEATTTSAAFHWGQRWYQYPCYQNYYALGGRYTACGVTNANGWIMVWVREAGRWGFTYMTCLEDVYP